jgi:FKBP-type peptidyl-prolyl cis-trans isomerase SlyD
MNIEKNYVVEFEYTLKDDNGKILDTSDGAEPLAYLHGYHNIVPGLEKVMEGKKANDSFNVKVIPEEGYGSWSEEMVKEVPKEQLKGIPNLKLGLQLQAETPHGIHVFSVSEIKEDVVILDGNHPLAGANLNFSIKVISVRKASPEEIAHGHVHGPHGHHH